MKKTFTDYMDEYITLKKAYAEEVKSIQTNRNYGLLTSNEFEGQILFESLKLDKEKTRIVKETGMSQDYINGWLDARSQFKSKSIK